MNIIHKKTSLNFIGFSGIGFAYYYVQWDSRMKKEAFMSKQILTYTIVIILLMIGISSANKPPGQQRDGMFIIDTVVNYQSAPYDQQSSAIAFDGTNYLVVWEDLRNSTDYNIHGNIVNQSGTILFPSGFAMSSANQNQTDPAVAFDGTNYFVVWKDERSGNSDIYGARINTAGVVLDTNGIPISTANSNQSEPAISFDGTNFLVVWTDYRNGSTPDIYGARVNTSGVLIDTNGIAISTASLEQQSPAIVFNGTNYLVVWQHQTSLGWDIKGARVTPSGTVLDPSGFDISYANNYQWYPAVAFDGTNCLVVWGDRRSGTREDIYGARVSPSGTVLDPDGFAISTYAQNGQYFPAVAFDGTNYLVVWDDYRSSTHNIYGARVTPNASVLDPNGRYISTASYDQLYPAIGFGGTNYFVVWDDYRTNTNFDIYGARVNTSATVLDPNGILVSSTINFQVAPSTAFDGTNYLTVWEDATSYGYYNIRGARIDQNGVVLDPSCINISTATNNQMSPDVAYGDTIYLVAWEDNRTGNYNIYGTIISRAGAVINPNGFIISGATNDQENPSVAFGDTNFFVVWEDYRTATNCNIYGARVTQNGTVLEPTGIAISTASNAQVCPDLAFDGTNFLVVWEDYRNNSSVSDIYATRVSQTGTVLNPSGIAISTASGSQFTPAIAFGGTNYLVVWLDLRNGAYDIYGARISPSGTVLDPSGIPICTNISSQMAPAVAFDGVNYVVLWQDARNGSWDIFGALVDLNGVVLQNFTVSTQTGNQIDPALAIGPGGQIFTVYSGYIDQINNKPVNTMRIWGYLYSLIGIEEDRTVPTGRLFLQSMPNPFRNTTEICYQINVQTADAQITIYDASGRLIKILEKGNKDKGIYKTKWDGTDENGNCVPDGIYFCKLKTGSYSETKKIVRLKE